MEGQYFHIEDRFWYATSVIMVVLFLALETAGTFLRMYLAHPSRADHPKVCAEQPLASQVLQPMRQFRIGDCQQIDAEIPYLVHLE